MSLSNPRTIFGIDSFAPYCRDTGLPFGIALILGQSNFALSGELVGLNGGSNRYKWDVQESNINAELSITLRQYEDWMMNLFLGKEPTTLTPSATGRITTLTDKKGSVVNGTWGIASVQIKTGSESDLKFARYVVKVHDKALDQVHVYALSKVDFGRGTDAEFQDDLLRITENPLTITNGGNIEVPGFGIELVGGTLIDFAANSEDGDTATFQVTPPDSASIKVRFGGTADVFKTFSAVVTGEQLGDGRMVDIDIFKIKAVGMPLNFAEKAWSEAEVTGEAFYDSEKNGVFDLDYTTPLAGAGC